MFNAVSYFAELTAKLKETAEFDSVKISGLDHLEGVLSAVKRKANLVAVDDTADGQMVYRNGGYFERRPYFVFVLRNFRGMDDRQAKLEDCRIIYRKFLSRMIRDKQRLLDDLIYMELEEMPFHELPGHFSANATGLYFGFYVDIPQDLSYKADDWN